MVTNAVKMDLKVNAPNGAKQLDGGGGFSDMLGNVSADNERRQPGLSSSDDRSFGKEFRYTKKAADNVSEIRERVGDQPEGGSEFASALSEQQADRAGKMLETAAETVVRAAAESGEVPSKEEAVEMMSEAVRDMASPRKQTEEQPEEPADKVVEVVAEVLAAINEGYAQPTDTPLREGDMDAGPVVHVITPDSSFLMTEKHVEAAMLSGADIPEDMPEMPDMTDVTGMFSKELEEVMNGYAGEEMPDDDAGLLMFTRNAQRMLDGQTRFDEPTDYVDRSDLFTKVLAKLESESEDDTLGFTVDMSAAKDTAEMLGEILAEAKKKLGLTDVAYERTTGETDMAAPLMQDEPARLVHSMNRSDRTDELDHILGSDTPRPDAKQEDGAPKTETYDAVHMTSELMGDRTHAGILADSPIERLDVPEENAGYRPPEVQAAAAILDRIESMQDDHTEFTMVLNPESLGKITVKLVMAGERTAVEITAENPQTREILAARSENLQSVLRDNGVELERYQVVSEQEDAQFERQSYDGSSKNPYSRDDSRQEKKDDDSDDGESFYDMLGRL